MSLTSLTVAGYRSIRSIRFPVRRLSVLVGGNGVGKTNLYRSLELLQCAATGALATEIAGEGGLSSVYFAGERKRENGRDQKSGSEHRSRETHGSVSVGDSGKNATGTSFE